MDWLERSLWIFLGLVVAVVLGGMIYQAMQPDFRLQKSEWECTQSHWNTYFMMAGKVMIPQRTEVCDNWKRITRESSDR